MKPATMRRLYVSRGVKTFLLSLWKTLPAVIRWGEILWVCLPASVCYSGTILLCLFSETVDVQLPHHTDQDPLATASTSLLFPHVDEFGESEGCVCDGEGEESKGFVFTGVCMKQRGMTFGISGGSEEDEYNYNNMENLMLKPQNWQDCCCLFSLNQLRNQSLYTLHVRSLKATDCIHKEVISKSTVVIFKAYTSPHVDLIIFHCWLQRLHSFWDLLCLK